MFFSSVVGSLLSLKASDCHSHADGLTCVMDEATVISMIGPHSSGRVSVHGVYWKARLVESLAETTIAAGKTVAVDYRRGLTLYVHPID